MLFLTMLRHPSRQGYHATGECPEMGVVLHLLLLLLLERCLLVWLLGSHLKLIDIKKKANRQIKDDTRYKNETNCNTPQKNKGVELKRREREERLISKVWERLSIVGHGVKLKWAKGKECAIFPRSKHKM